MVRPVDTVEMRRTLDRFIGQYVSQEPSILGVRVLDAGSGPYLEVSVMLGAPPPSLPTAYDGLRVVAHERRPSSAAVGPLR